MRRGSSLRKTIIAIVIGAITYIVLRIVDGLIGNSAFVLFSRVWGWVTTSISANSWLWIMILIILLISLTETFILLNQSRSLKDAHTIADSMVELDDSLQRLLVILVSAQDLKTELQRLLEALLRDAIRTFPENISRASILLPNSPNSNEEYLHIRVSYKMPAESIIRTKFYIGNDVDRNLERGVAGIAYRDLQLCIAHIKQASDHWVCDDQNFINCDRSHSRPPYNSFVCVPIIAPSGGNTIVCLGVLCFDSDSSKAFDAPQNQKLLRAFGRRVAIALLIYIQLLHFHNQTIAY